MAERMVPSPHTLVFSQAGILCKEGFEGSSGWTDSHPLVKSRVSDEWSLPECLGNTAVHERNVLEKSPAGTGRCPDFLDRTLKNFG